MTHDRVARFVVPEGVNDPERVSGGNVYDRRLRDGLAALGWDIAMHEASDADAVAAALDDVPSRGTVLVDGLVAAWHPGAIEAAASRARVVVLAHMVASAFAGADAASIEGERRSLGHATRVIATSNWTAAEFVRRGLVDERRLTVAAPGSVDGPLSQGGVGELLCVGAVARHKGQDLLLEALGGLRELEWSCTIAGSPEVDRDFTRQITEKASTFAPRVRMTGVLRSAALVDAYWRSGLLVAPSRTESFGMAIADAQRRGLPVIAAAVGGIPEAVSGGGALLVKPDDVDALADALRSWMTDPILRARLRAEASRARRRAPRWADTVARVDRLLEAA
ncbi:MAG: glycosyltransferase family 4 protein [Pseudolysinimonas sp.]